MPHPNPKWSTNKHHNVIRADVSRFLQAYLGDVLHDYDLEPIPIASERFLEIVTLGNRSRRAAYGISSLEQVLHDPSSNVPRRARYEHLGRRLNGRHRSTVAVDLRYEGISAREEVTDIAITLCVGLAGLRCTFERLVYLYLVAGHEACSLLSRKSRS